MRRTPEFFNYLMTAARSHLRLADLGMAHDRQPLTTGAMTMTDVILYTVLHDSTGNHPQCTKGPVRAVPHNGAGYSAHYFAGHGLIEPDYAAVRECLPHYWRKAWDRRNGEPDSDGGYAIDVA